MVLKYCGPVYSDLGEAKRAQTVGAGGHREMVGRG